MVATRRARSTAASTTSLASCVRSTAPVVASSSTRSVSTRANAVVGAGSGGGSGTVVVEVVTAGATVVDVGGGVGAVALVVDVGDVGDVVVVAVAAGWVDVVVPAVEVVVAAVGLLVEVVAALSRSDVDGVESVVASSRTAGNDPVGSCSPVVVATELADSPFALHAASAIAAAIVNVVARARRDGMRAP